MSTQLLIPSCIELSRLFQPTKPWPTINAMSWRRTIDGHRSMMKSSRSITTTPMRHFFYRICTNYPKIFVFVWRTVSLIRLPWPPSKKQVNHCVHSKRSGEFNTFSFQDDWIGGWIKNYPVRNSTRCSPAVMGIVYYMPRHWVSASRREAIDEKSTL